MRHSTSSSAQVLLFTRTEGFRHASIPDGIAMVNALATEVGLTVTATEDAAVFEPIGLAGHSVVIFLSTSGDVLDAAQQSALESFVETGGGWVGIHSAADTEYAWPWYGELLGNGAWFLSHPAIQEARVELDDRSHPSTDGQPKSRLFTEEWYNFQANPRPVVTVAQVLDEASYDPGADAMGSDHPISWWQEIVSGRSYYTGLGHRSETYTDPHFREQIRGAILWAGGLLVCPHPDSLTITGESIVEEVEFRACSELEIGDTSVFGPSGHAVLRAANLAALANDFVVSVDGEMTIFTGQSLYGPPP